MIRNTSSIPIFTRVRAALARIRALEVKKIGAIANLRTGSVTVRVGRDMSRDIQSIQVGGVSSWWIAKLICSELLLHPFPLEIKVIFRREPA